jgi:hypothetical protein
MRRLKPTLQANARQPDAHARSISSGPDTLMRSPVMGKGNKVRKREVKKPKQDKKTKQANKAAKTASTGVMPTPQA